MSATYVDRATIADDEVFKGRVKVALMTAAITTALTPFDASKESDIVYKHRVKFSIDVIFTDPAGYLGAFVDGLVWNSQLIPNMVDIVAAHADLTAVGDMMIQAAVNAVFQFMAGVWWA